MTPQVLDRILSVVKILVVVLVALLVLAFWTIYQRAQEIKGGERG